MRRLVHFSSVEALSAEPRDEVTDEERPLLEGRAADPYAVSKAEGERVVRTAAAEGLDTVILYPTGVIGPYDFKPSLLGRALIAIARGEFPALVAGGFDWVDVRRRGPGSRGVGGEGAGGLALHVGGRWASLVELAALVCALTGARLPRIVVPAALAQAWAPVAAAAARVSGAPPLFTSSTLRMIGEVRRVSWARAAGDLGYVPRGLAETVRDTCLWLAGAGLLAGSACGRFAGIRGKHEPEGRSLGCARGEAHGAPEVLFCQQLHAPRAQAPAGSLCGEAALEDLAAASGGMAPALCTSKRTLPPSTGRNPTVTAAPSGEASSAFFSMLPSTRITSESSLTKVKVSEKPATTTDLPRAASWPWNSA